MRKRTTIVSEANQIKTWRQLPSRSQLIMCIEKMGDIYQKEAMRIMTLIDQLNVHNSGKTQ